MHACRICPQVPFVAVWRVPHSPMLRVFVTALLLCDSGHGWWFKGNVTSDPPPQTTWERFSEQFPTFSDQVFQWRDWGSKIFSETQSWTERLEVPKVEFGFSLSLVIDTMVGFLGWAVFGNAWHGVKSGCRRVLQIGALFLACLIAHYIWAVCYPVVSIIVACLMAVVWVCRKMLRLVGTVIFHVHRWQEEPQKLRMWSSTGRGQVWFLRPQFCAVSRGLAMLSSRWWCAEATRWRSSTLVVMFRTSARMDCSFLSRPTLSGGHLAWWERSQSWTRFICAATLCAGRSRRTLHWVWRCAEVQPGEVSGCALASRCYGRNSKPLAMATSQGKADGERGRQSHSRVRIWVWDGGATVQCQSTVMEDRRWCTVFGWVPGVQQ